MTETITSTDQTFGPIAPGVELAVLRRHADRGLTFLIRMAKGARAPMHDHPGGEETYMLRGTLRIEHRALDGTVLPAVRLTPGDYLFAAPGETHDGIADDDALFLVVAPGGVLPVGERTAVVAP